VTTLSATSELGQAPSRKRLVEVLGVAQRDPLDLLALWQREHLRPPAAVTRVKRIESVGVEVMDQTLPGNKLGRKSPRFRGAKPSYWSQSGMEARAS